MRLAHLSLAASLILAGCADAESTDIVPVRDSGVRADSTASDTTTGDDTATGDDTGAGKDTGGGSDTGSGDTGSVDTGSGFDTGTFDTGTFDTGTGFDTGTFDTSAFDTGFDTGTFDTGTFDTAFDSGTTDSIVVVDTGTDTGVVADKTTGKVCTSDIDCDVTGYGLGHCTNKLYIVGPLNPTAVCMQIDFGGGDACVPTDATTIYYCDGDTGICLQSGTSPATCEPRCQLKGDGTWVEKCAGNNACYPEALTTATDGKTLVVGSCQGGCVTSADCPSGSVCDVGQNLCVNKTCTSDAGCKTAWGTGAPAAYKCDFTSGYCKFLYSKVLGDTCTTATDCLCLKGTTTAGYCTTICKTGSAGECPTGYSCDSLLTAKSTTGTDLYTMTSLAAGLSGYCAKNCTSDLGCATGTTCKLSGGMGTQKTCQP